MRRQAVAPSGLKQLLEEAMRGGGGGWEQVGGKGGGGNWWEEKGRWELVERDERSVGASRREEVMIPMGNAEGKIVRENIEANLKKEDRARELY